MTEKNIRAFLALEVKDRETIQNLGIIQQELKKIIEPIKAVETENIHITIRFLANISMEMAKKIYFFLEENINSKFFKDGPLEFDVVGLEDFNRRVFFVNLNGQTKKLLNMNGIVEDTLVNNHNFKRDSRFQTHITIARLKRSRTKKKTFNREKYSELKKHYSNLVLGRVKFKKIHLKKSTLLPSGPIYENLVF